MKQKIVKQILITAEEGMVLTNGKIYATQIRISNNMKPEDFWEIPKSEYDSIAAESRKEEAKLVYRCRGIVAFLNESAAVKKEGVISVEADVKDGCILSLRPGGCKEEIDYLFVNGKADVPAEIFRGITNVRIHYGNGECTAMATPIVEAKIGDAIYLMGGRFNVEEELARTAEVLRYAKVRLQEMEAEVSKVRQKNEELVALVKKAMAEGQLK